MSPLRRSSRHRQSVVPFDERYTEVEVRKRRKLPQKLQAAPAGPSIPEGKPVKAERLFSPLREILVTQPPPVPLKLEEDPQKPVRTEIGGIGQLESDTEGNDSEDEYQDGEVDIFDGPEYDYKAHSEQICATDAMKIYHLTRRDLDRLKFQARRNPHYRNAAPMRLYLRSEVIELAKAMVEIRAHEKTNRQKQAEEAAARRKVAGQQAAAIAKQIVTDFKPFKTDPIDSGLSKAWPCILPRLVSALCSENAIADSGHINKAMKELSNLALTCREMNHFVTAIALPALGKKATPNAWLGSAKTGAEPKLEIDWNMILADAKACKLPMLKEAAKSLGLSKSGTKDELTLRILKDFEMPTPCPKQIPAAVAFALRDIRKQAHYQRLTCDAMQAALGKSVENAHHFLGGKSDDDEFGSDSEEGDEYNDVRFGWYGYSSSDSSAASGGLHEYLSLN